MPKGIDPAAWLAEHDPRAAQADPFSHSNDALLLGDDELASAGCDLSRALSSTSSLDCRAEIILAWLVVQARDHGPTAAVAGIMLAARIVGRLNAHSE